MSTNPVPESAGPPAGVSSRGAEHLYWRCCWSRRPWSSEPTGSGCCPRSGSPIPGTGSSLARAPWPPSAASDACSPTRARTRTSRTTPSPGSCWSSASVDSSQRGWSPRSCCLCSASSFSSLTRDEPPRQPA